VWLEAWLAGRPPRNVWLGTTAEDEARARQRIPILLEIPAAVRFVSHEPALESVDFRQYTHGLDWIITGGESGPGARPYHPEWAERVIEQCRDAGIAPFVKQMGAHVLGSMRDGAPHYFWPVGTDFGTYRDAYPPRVKLKNKKGGNPAEWPECVRVREFPS